MPIQFNAKTGVFSMNTDHSTYQCRVIEHDMLIHLYYGKKILHSEITHMNNRYDRGFSGNPYEAENDRTFSMDTFMQEYSVFGVGDFRSAALSVTQPDGSNAVDLRFQSYKIYDGKPGVKGMPAVYADEKEAQTLEIVLKDKYSAAEVTLIYSVLPEKDVITRSAVFRNTGEKPVFLERALSCTLDFPDSRYDILTFYGRHAMERNLERTPLRHGKISVESVRGNSSHQQNPFAILCEPSATETAGECYGIQLVYSGNFLAEAEVDQLNQTRLVMGINPTGFRFKVESGEEFATPEVILCYNADGLGGLSRKLHSLLRNHICRGKYKDARRPVLINNWEATYFDFDDEKILKIAQGAAELGIEMLVLDDGWFGKRDGDLSGLGDWFVNADKLKNGLGLLAEKINAMGMKFGLWFEPENVSEDSDLYRAHPDWALKIPNRSPNRARYQLVLDMSRADVRDFLYQSISEVLKSAHIEYVKWDMNRHLTDIYSAVLPAERQGEVFHRYMLGVYDLLERLTAAFPDILFEGCSGGGGRFDAGMLYYSPQIWCSDNTDAAERLFIQYGTSYGYPVSSMGAHVSACPNHQTGRSVPLKTRGAVAAAGTFGYEMDLNKLSQEEKDEICVQVAFYKKNYELINFGDYYRLNNPYEIPDYTAWQMVSPDKNRALVTFVSLRAQANAPLHRIRLQGLDEAKLYRVSGIEQPLSGSALMYAGLLMPMLFNDYQSVQIVIESV